MTDPKIIELTETIRKSDTGLKKIQTSTTNDVVQKELIETTAERTFKEGLANNSDTDKNSTK